MIPFFRRIRQRLLTKNKFSRYLLYAIGEIVLVVLGILIALQINNWNEERKTFKNAKLLLNQVHEELAFNINKAKKVIEFYRRKDSLVYTVLTKKVTYDDYKDSREYTSLLFGIEEVNIADDAYRNLMVHHNQFNREQDVIISKLKELYGTDKNYVDVTDEHCVTNLFQRIEKLKNEQTWFYDYFALGEDTEEMILYFLTDAYYLNEVTRYQQINLGYHTQVTLDFRDHAILIYDELSGYLGIQKDSSIVKDLNVYEHYIGTYISEHSQYNNQIIRKKDQLLWTWERKKDPADFGEIKFYPDSKTHFTAPDHTFGTLVYDENQNVSGFIRSNGIYRLEYKKMQ